MSNHAVAVDTTALDPCQVIGGEITRATANCTKEFQHDSWPLEGPIRHRFFSHVGQGIIET